MHVKKFEADSIEEALKDIKLALGPDAIILKTVTNKGLKGAFKKKKIEITAAISEKNYLKKAQVDKVLGPEQKQEFYAASAEEISQQIERYGKTAPATAGTSAPSNAPTGYGNLGLNRPVRTSLENQIKSDLDSFLQGTSSTAAVAANSSSTTESATASAAPTGEMAAPTPEDWKNYTANGEDALQMQARIDELERQIYVLNQSVAKIERKEPHNVYQLRTILRSLEVSEGYIQKLIKKLLFELSEEEIGQAEKVFEFALREMGQEIVTAMPLFSQVGKTKEPPVTVLLSETSCGQSAMALKLAALQKESVVIKLMGHQEESAGFAEKVLSINVIRVRTPAEVVTEIRKALGEKKSVLVDYRGGPELNETKNFVEGLRRSFARVEILISLSAIHSPLYNRKVINTYRTLANGINVTFIDQCLNFGQLFNLNLEYKDLPLMFFGTGSVIPDDVEAATSERIMAEIFKLP
ncbi:MAG: hypothetical protein J6Y94_07790 [Bacteriovoracaceae bacterium]|nr:hypothetical protein [Bacteriovoracaceae bacterium]